MTDQERSGPQRFRSLPPRVSPAQTVAVHEQPGDADRLGWAVLGTLGALTAGGALGDGGCGDGGGGCG